MVNYVQFIENIQFPSNHLNQPKKKHSFLPEQLWKFKNRSNRISKKFQILLKFLKSTKIFKVPKITLQMNIMVYSEISVHLKSFNA